MKSILWYQHSDTSVGDVIFLNGEKVTDKRLEILNFNTIKKRADKVIKKSAPWCGMVSGLFFMKGFLTTRDEQNRRMVFLYVTDKPNYKEACFEELEAAGLEMSEESKSCINKPLDKSYKLYLGFLVAIAIIACVLAAICTSNTSTNTKDSCETSLQQIAK